MRISLIILATAFLVQPALANDWRVRPAAPAAASSNIEGGYDNFAKADKACGRAGTIFEHGRYYCAGDNRSNRNRPRVGSYDPADCDDGSALGYDRRRDRARICSVPHVEFGMIKGPHEKMRGVPAPDDVVGVYVTTRAN